MSLYGYWGIPADSSVGRRCAWLAANRGSDVIGQGDHGAIVVDPNNPLLAARGWRIRQISDERHRGVVLGKFIPRASGQQLSADRLAVRDVLKSGAQAPWGQYAAAWCDRRVSQLVLTVDPMSLHNLFVLPIGGGYVFATRLRDLVALLGHVPAIDVNEVTRLLDGAPELSIVEGLWRLPFRDVRRLGFGSVVAIGPNGLHIEQRWQMSELASTDQPPSHEEFRTVLTTCVAEWLSDVDSAVVSLSGGLDSSTIAWAATRSGVLTGAIHRDTSELASTSSERAFAMAVVERLGLPPLAIVGPNVLPLDEPRIVAADPVFPDMPLLQGAVSEAVLAAAEGSMVISGEGGDEVFGRWNFPYFVHDEWLRNGAVAGFAQLHELSYRDGEPIFARLRHLVAGALACRRGLAAAYEAVNQPVSLPGWVRSTSFRRTRLANGVSVPSGMGLGRVDYLLGVFSAVRAIGQLMSVYRGRFVHPLLSPPLIELMLRVPMGDLGDIEVDRLFVRRAMRGRLPDQVVQRMSKGEYSGQWCAGLRRHREFATQLIAEGALTRAGIVDCDKLLAELTSVTAGVVQHTVPVMQAVLIEHWLRVWRRYAI